MKAIFFKTYSTTRCSLIVRTPTIGSLIERNLYCRVDRYSSSR